MLASAFPNRVSSESHECSHSDGRVAFEVDEINGSKVSEANMPIKKADAKAPTLFHSGRYLGHT